MVLGWCIRVSLRQSLNNQTREYTNIQILKKALFSMFPSYSIARLHGRNAENFQVMQVSCNVQHRHTKSCIYKTSYILWVRLDKRLTLCYTTYVPLDWNKYLWINSEKNSWQILWVWYTNNVSEREKRNSPLSMKTMNLSSVSLL